MKQRGKVPHKLERTVFTIPRLLDYFTEDELTKQTGYHRDLWWPAVVAKELIDNALDACEQAGVAPRLQIQFADGCFEITDNAGGIPPDTVRRAFDYAVRASDKQAYVSPTRGAQGNALKTILAIPYVLSGSKTGIVEIGARGVRHRLSVAPGPIKPEPRISHKTEEIVKTEGTTVRVGKKGTSPQAAPQELEILQNLVRDFSLFNPHATFVLNGQRFKATSPTWTKWLLTDPTSPHWYSPDQFALLINAYVAAEDEGGRARTAREFVSEFRGLSSSAKQAKVVAAAGLNREYLRALAGVDGNINVRNKLLGAMKEESKPVKPEGLGVLGEEHFRCRLQASGETFRYSRQSGFDQAGRPYLVECAFGLVDNDSPWRGLHTGLNWSVPLGQPLQQTEFLIDGEQAVTGLTAVLARQRIDIKADPVCLAIHLAHPRFTFLDRGKGSVQL